MTWKRNLKQVVFNLLISHTQPFALCVFASGSVSFHHSVSSFLTPFSPPLSLSLTLFIILFLSYYSPFHWLSLLFMFIAKPSSQLSRLYFLHLRDQLRWLANCLNLSGFTIHRKEDLTGSAWVRYYPWSNQRWAAKQSHDTNMHRSGCAEVLWGYGEEYFSEKGYHHELNV